MGGLEADRATVEGPRGAVVGGEGLVDTTARVGPLGRVGVAAPVGVGDGEVRGGDGEGGEEGEEGGGLGRHFDGYVWVRLVGFGDGG